MHGYTLCPLKVISLPIVIRILLLNSLFSKDFEYTGEILYFAGPTQYFTRNDDGYRNIQSNSLLSEEELEVRISEFDALTLEITVDTKPFSTLSDIATCASKSLDKDDFPLYNYNNDGRCGSVSAAILLAYYKNNGYSGLVSSTHYNNDVLFTNYLYNHIEGLDSSYNGSTTSDLVSGLNWYLETKGYSSQLAAYSVADGSFSTFVNKIKAGTPVILDLNAHPTYKEHWVVGYGYDYDQFVIKYNKFAIANDGWGNNEIEINWEYVGDLVYLK